MPISTIPASPHYCNPLTPPQRTDLAAVQQYFADAFFPPPGHTQLIKPDFKNCPNKTMHSQTYRLPENKRQIVWKELAAMLEMGVLEVQCLVWLHSSFVKERWVYRFLCGPQGKWSVTVWCLSHACTAHFFHTGFDLGLLADSLVFKSKEKMAFSTTYTAYDTTYRDNVIIHSDIWQKVTEVLVLEPGGVHNQ